MTDRLTGAAGRSSRAFAWRRPAKYAAGLVLVAIGALTTYQNVLVRGSREAVVNGRTIAVRAPIDGILTTSLSATGSTVQTGMTMGRVEDPHPDDARLFALQQEMTAVRHERDALSQRLTDLERARREADAQAEAYRAGRVRQDELRVEEAQAGLTAAMAREADAASAAQRGAALHLHGFQSDDVYEQRQHARDITQNERTAAQKRLDALQVELAAAHTGTYLGDNYNDVPSSFQRARELAVRIDETRATLNQLGSKIETLTEQLSAEQERLKSRTVATLSAPIAGNVWTALAASGEYVRKGQDLFTVLDCSTVMVTASVSERDYNGLRIGDPVRFRVAGTGREYAGTISKLGLTGTGASFAIAPEDHHQQLAISVPQLAASDEDRCAVGRHRRGDL
jgi:multidrug resistance efflux pump